MTDASNRPAIEVDPEIALALRDWLVTLSQRLGLDATAAAAAPTPPTTTAPETIAPYLGELAAILDTTQYLRSDTATVRITIEREPAPDAEPTADIECERMVFDDRADQADTDSALGQSYTSDPDPYRDVNSEMSSTSIPDRGYYVDPERDPQDNDLAIHAALADEIWYATSTRSPPNGPRTSSSSSPTDATSKTDEDNPSSGLE